LHLSRGIVLRQRTFNETTSSIIVRRQPRLPWKVRETNSAQNEKNILGIKAGAAIHRRDIDQECSPIVPLND
jgi:hypothetical protein